MDIPSGLMFNVTSLDLGDYPLLVSVNDTYDNTDEKTIIVSIQDNTNPLPVDLLNVNYEVGNSGFWLNWSCSDLLPAFYDLRLDDVSIMDDTWDGSDIAFYVIGHEPGHGMG